MGATYANTVVFGTELAAVRAACARPAYVTDLGEAVAVFTRSDDELEPAAPELSSALPGAVVWSVSVFDSDLLSSSVHVDGQEITTGTVPDPIELFGDVAGTDAGPPLDAAALVAALGRGDPEIVRTILEADELFAEDRHARLCTAVGVDRRVAGCGYRYLTVDPNGWQPTELEHLT